MTGNRKVINLLAVEQDSSGCLDLYQGKPFTGLVVEVSSNGEVVAVTELVNGRPHGYAVDYLGGGPLSVDEYDRGTPHGLSARWRNGRLTGASRIQYGLEDQRLCSDGAIEELPGMVAKIARIHAREWKHVMLGASVGALLARFAQRCDRLLVEASEGLGLV